MLQWIVGHPLLRPHQLSLAFFELTPEMNWRYVQGVGPLALTNLSGVDDAAICTFRESNKSLPWGYFKWSQMASDFQPPNDVVDLVGLCLGEHDFSDGLLLCASKNSFKFESYAPIYSFIRVASEFVYRHHYLHSSPEMKANSYVASDLLVDENLKEPLEFSEPVERDSSLDGVVLTERQAEILEHISAGLTNEEMAAEMHLSLGTIRVETSRLYDRLGARNRQQAASLAHLVLDH